jgi:phage terminase large subunit-like protein
MTIAPAKLDRWRADPVRFVAEALHDPETGLPFQTFSQQDQFLRAALTLTEDGRLPYPELVFSAPKKSGKTALAAIAMLYVVIVLGGRFAEGYAVANDLDQAVGRVFAACCRMVECSPIFAGEATITARRITFPELGSFIEAIPSDYAGAAGSNPSFVVFDELWAYTTERAHRLWDEMIPPPTRKVTARLTCTYAGFEGESALLESLVKRGLAGEQIAPDLYQQPGMLAFISNRLIAPWQTTAWREEMRQSLRPNAFLRLIENRFVGSESSFIPIEWWDACCSDRVRPLIADRSLPVWIGVDASTKRDSTALAVTAWDAEAKKVRLVLHRIWQPSQDQPLDFESTVEATLLELAQRFKVQEVRFDPYQMQSVAQRLTKAGLPMVEFPQTTGKLTDASSNLYETIKAQGFIAYQDADIRLAMQRAVAVEASRGWRITKEKTSHKIDVVVALGMAALATVREASTRRGIASWGIMSAPGSGSITWAHEQDKPHPLKGGPHQTGRGSSTKKSNTKFLRY